MNIKAQVSAPIELLIGVIILGMVMMIGFYTYDNMCTSQYDQKIKASLAKFANDLETVYAGSKGTKMLSNLDFSPMGCGREIEALKFLKGSAKLCQKNVGTDSCYVLAATGKYIVNNQPAGEVRFAQVLKIPTDVAIVHVHKTADPEDLDVACTTLDTIKGMLPPGVEREYSTLLTQLDEVFEDYTKAGWEDTCYVWGPYNYVLQISKTDKDEIMVSEITD